MILPKNDEVSELISLALREDLGGEGDITSQCFVAEDAHGSGRIIGKEEGLVVSGLAVAERVFLAIDDRVEFVRLAADGEEIPRGKVVAEVRGKFRSLLMGERTALNFLQRLSGVATTTRRYVRAAEGTGVRVLDTRKTTPGWRSLEKEAVRHGGAQNHRMGLYDAFMVKDNHLLAMPGTADLEKLVAEARARFPGRKMQVEADTLEQVQRFLSMQGVDFILLDNMSAAQLREGVALRNRLNPAVLLEASGGVNLDTIRELAGTGVDFISVGALTHSARAVDLALDLCVGASGSQP